MDGTTKQCESANSDELPEEASRNSPPVRQTKRRWWINRLLALTFALSILLIAVPLPYEITAISNRQLTLKRSYLRCCQTLADEKVQQELFNTTGIDSSNSADGSPTAAADEDSWFLSALAHPLTGSFSRSEDFRVRCLTDLGWVDLDLHQDSHFSFNELSVSTVSVGEQDKLKCYRHSLRLLPSKSQTLAIVELEIRVKIWVPWFFHATAKSRVDNSVDSQLESFANCLLRSVQR